MKKVLFIFLVFCCYLSSEVFSLDLELTGGLGNIAFNQQRTSPLGNPDNPGIFAPHLFPLVLARLSGEYKNLAYNAGFERDPLLKNRLFANLRVDLDYFFIEAGPVIGFFNSSKLPLNPGISAALGLEVPGIVFVRAGGASTLGINMDITDNYSENTGDISAGFWVPHVICSLNMNVRNFTAREQANLLIENELTRYFFSANVYTKNIPYTIRVNMGYEQLSRSYVSQKVNGGGNIVNDTQTDEFKAVFLGLEATYTFSPALKFLLGGETPVYSWSVRPMKDPGKGTVFFEAHIGVIWKIANSNGQ